MSGVAAVREGCHFEDEDALLEGLLQTAQQLCMDVARMADEASQKRTVKAICAWSVVVPASVLSVPPSPLTVAWHP